MAERLDAMPKYVVSATLRSDDEWDHTTIGGYDDIACLREHEQLLTYGCASPTARPSRPAPSGCPRPAA